MIHWQTNAQLVEEALLGTEYETKYVNDNWRNSNRRFRDDYDRSPSGNRRLVLLAAGYLAALVGLVCVVNTLWPVGK